MMQVNMFEAKSDLSKLVKMLETQQEDVIYIARNGVEVAQITLIPKADTSKRIGIAKANSAFQRILTALMMKFQLYLREI